MNCCINCFVSPHLKNRINRDRALGDCNFCQSENIHILNPRELFYSFQSIFEQYTLSDNGSLSVTQIKKDFPNLIFSDLHNEIIDNLLREILADDLETYKEFLENKIILKCDENPEFEKDINILQISWEEFVNEIKSENRFHIKKVLDFKQLERLLGMTITPLERGKIFYRGRISDIYGFPKEQMGNPPPHLTKSGRANPVGISYLYVANDIPTTLYETRAALHDYVCIGEFRLAEDIKIVDLKEVGKQDPFDLAVNEILGDYLAYLPFLEGLGNELSKPIRRNDSELDYLPTQYLTEFIKSIGADGVAYGSSLNKTGKNLAVFYPDKFECINIKVCEITNIEYSYQEII